jgi:hypothetical protein
LTVTAAPGGVETKFTVVVFGTITAAASVGATVLVAAHLDVVVLRGVMLCSVGGGVGISGVGVSSGVSLGVAVASGWRVTSSRVMAPPFQWRCVRSGK